MHDLAAAHINSHMARVAHDIAGLGVFQAAHCRTHIPVRRGRVRQAHTEIRIHAHDKAGAVRTVREGRTAVYIRISNKLAGKIRH